MKPREIGILLPILYTVQVGHLFLILGHTIHNHGDRILSVKRKSSTDNKSG